MSSRDEPRLLAREEIAFRAGQTVVHLQYPVVARERAGGIRCRGVHRPLPEPKALRGRFGKALRARSESDLSNRVPVRRPSPVDQTLLAE